MRLRSRSLVLWMSLLAAACNGCPGNDDRAAGEYEILAEGEGETNAEPLERPGARVPLVRSFDFQSTSVRDAIWRGPTDVEGHEVHRMILDGPQSLGTYGEHGFQSGEVWVAFDDVGSWLLGGTEDGLLPGGVLRYPKTLREGMKWRSRPSKDFEWYTFDVFERRVEATPLGEETVTWVIRQLDASGEPMVFRSYVEGWGQATVADRSTALPNFEWVWQVALDPDETVERIPTIALEPAAAIHQIELKPGQPSPPPEARRVRYINAFGNRDGDTTLSFIGLASWEGSNAGPGRPATGQWTISGRSASLQRSSGGGIGSLQYDPPFRGWPNVHFDTTEGAYGRYEPIEATGTTIQTANGVYTASGDFVMFEYPDGAIGGFYGIESGHGCPSIGPRGCGVRLFGPPDDLDATREPTLFGGSLFTADRALQGPRDGDVIRWAQHGRGSGVVDELWSVHADILENALVTRPARFVSLAPQGVSTLATPDGHTYYLASPGGVVTSIAIAADGSVSRETVGRAELEPGQSLVAAVGTGGNDYVFVTRDDETGEDLVWGGVAPTAPKRAPKETSVVIESLGRDARICWPPTDEVLDPEGWLLGGVPVVAVTEVSEGCALISRDLGVEPTTPDDAPPGYSVFEGAVPGIGPVRAFFPPSVAPSPGREMIQATWRKGGGYMANVREREFANTNIMGTVAGGLPNGRPPFTPFGRSNLEIIPDLAGNGLWLMGVLDNISDPTATGLALSGPEPLLLPLIDGEGTIDGVLPVEGGGVLVGAFVLEASEHTGLAIVRPDGEILEIEHPIDGNPILVRANNEVCGTRRKTVNGGGTENWVYCSAPDGTVRERQLIPTEDGAVSITPFIQAPTMLAPIFDGRLALVERRDGTAEVSAALLDLDELDLIDYPLPEEFIGSVGVHAGVLGADGVFYASLRSGNTVGDTLAFTKDGVTPVSEHLDSLGIPIDGVTRVIVGEQFAFVFDSVSRPMRIPRSIWDGDRACEPTTEDALDSDGDGAIAASSCGPDCDDSNPDVHPGAAEVCDGVDNDCDGRTDEGGSTCWQDMDGDGFAPEGAAKMMACECGEGWTDLEPTGENIDCSDLSADAHPGQTAFFATGIEQGTPSGLYFDYDCDGVETRELPTGSCSYGVDSCVMEDGFISGGATCGTYGDFLGCVEPGNCSPGDCVDTGGLLCQATGEMLRLQQRCR